MKRYFSKTITLFLSMFVLSNSLIANPGDVKAGWFEKFPKKTAVALAIMGSIGWKLGTTFFTQRSLSQEMQRRLTTTSVRGENFSFQDYRIRDIYSDGKYWVAASQILADKAEFKKRLQKDIGQGSRIYINGKPCKLENNEKFTRLKLFENIKNSLEQEISTLRRSIICLSRYTDVDTIIQKLINADYSTGQKPSWADNAALNTISHFGNADEYFVTFSKFPTDQLQDFNNDLMQQITANNTWWKKITCPYYVQLSQQYWDFVKRYIRVCAISNLIDESLEEDSEEGSSSSEEETD